MNKITSRKLFYLFVFIFFLALALLAYDFSRKTTFPTSKKRDLKIEQQEKRDSAKIEAEKLIEPQ